MNKYLKIFAISILSALLITGCKKEDKKSNPTMDDISFHTDEEESDPRPGYPDLPSAGDDAISPLTLDITPTYFNNTDLHNITGQWSGYGIHNPSILEYKGTYYLYISTPDSNVGIRAYRSKDLLNWEYISESGLSMGYISKDRFTFAAKSPQVLRIGDDFYLYFKSMNGYKIYKGLSPEGPFEEYKELNYDSSFSGKIYQAPNGKLFFISGGENSASIYEMNSLSEIDFNSKEEIPATKSDTYFGNKIEINSPSLSYIDGICYLTYSSQKESFKSYRSYLVSAIDPDFSSSKSLADSFFNQKISPLLINGDEDNGSIGFGDISFVEGPDSVNYFAIYTSYETTSTRRLNIAPIKFSGANVSIAHRDTNVLYPHEEMVEVVKDYENLVLSDSETNKTFTASYSFKNLETIYFGYKTKNNNYSVNIADNKATLVKRENGLNSELASIPVLGQYHEVKVSFNGVLQVFIDNQLLYLGEAEVAPGKIGYLDIDSSAVDYVRYTNTDSLNSARNNPTTGEAFIYAKSYLAEESSLAEENKIKMVSNANNDFYGTLYLNMTHKNDYARFIADVNEDGRYAVELVLNASFTNNCSTLGIRVGTNKEYIYETTPLGESGFAKTLTVEFDLNKGPNEVLIENLSGDVLRLVSIRLVKVSSSAPKYTIGLDTFATKGVKYLTDFRINDNFHCHETYEGARSFAYVGDNTFTDFKMSVDVGFLGGTSTAGFVSLGFRCSNYVSSSIDDDESMTGYYLEISQYQTKLMKHNYGYGQTLGVIDYANQVGEFNTYTINMKGNKIEVYAGYQQDFLMFSIVDQYAFTSGRLSFGSKNTNGLIKNFVVDPAE